MAKPRIFVSSTFYDLKYIRTDLERFIRGMGYEPVLNEYGHIPYGSQEKLEEYCYREVGLCDILIGIIGGRFGSQADASENSITQREIKTALEQGKQVYIFIDKNVNTEFYTYQANKDNKDVAERIRYASIDNNKIFEYIEEVRALTHNNTIHPFEGIEDICNFLKEQWAGLFKNFLQNQANQRYMTTLDEIKSTANTLQNLVDYLSSQNEESRNAIKDILVSTHPAMDSLRTTLNIKARIYFSNAHEMFDCLNLFGFKKEVEQFSISSFFNYSRKKAACRENKTIKEIIPETENFDKIVNDFKKEKTYVFTKLLGEFTSFLIINKNIFDSTGKLIPCINKEWDNNNIEYFTLEGKIMKTISKCNVKIDEDMQKKLLLASIMHASRED